MSNNAEGKGQLNSRHAVIANGLEVLYPHHLEIDHDHQSSNGEALQGEI